MQGMDDGTAVVFYVVCVSGSRIGLAVIYIHIESIDFLRVNLEHAHWDTSTDGACAIRKKRQLRGVIPDYHTTRPLPAYFELRGLTPAHLHYAAVT